MKKRLNFLLGMVAGIVLYNYFLFDMIVDSRSKEFGASEYKSGQWVNKQEYKYLITYIKNGTFKD